MVRRRRRASVRDRAAHQGRRVAAEVRLARAALRMSRRQVAHLAGVATSTVIRIERGDPGVQLDTLTAVCRAVGLDVVVSVYPGPTPGLRDSGQLRVADGLRRQAHSAWRPRLEVPAGEHGRSADLVLAGPEEMLHVEIERSIVDFQAQYRAGAAKREFLAARDTRPVRLVIVVEDSRRNRSAVAPHVDLIRVALPAGSRSVLSSLRSGKPLGRDGLLWYRPIQPER